MGTDRSRWAELLTLAWPIAVAMLGDAALGICDAGLVGALGARALGGVSVAAALHGLGYALIAGLMRGVKVRSARASGAGRPGDGARHAQAGALLGALFGVAMLLASRDLTRLLEALGLERSMIPLARDFAAARSWGAPAACAAAALVQHLQGVGDTRTPMLVGLAGNAGNVALAWVLIHGRLGLPVLGVRGAGYATAVVETLGLVALVLVARGRWRRARTPPPSMGLGAALRDVAGVGVPMGLQFGLESLALTTFVVIVGTLGAAEAAATQIVISAMRASSLPGVAVSEAASVLVARALGERRPGEADRVAATSIALGGGYMTACGLLIAPLGAVIARSFASDPEVIQVARRLFVIASAFQGLEAVHLILRGALRGAGDARWAAVTGVTVAWLAVPGSALLFGRVAGWGAVGGWLGFVLETALGAILLHRRWSRGPWRAPQPRARRPRCAPAT